MKALTKRVAAMERPVPVGCDTCRYWNRTIVVTVEVDGTETGRSRPDQCPECGRVVPVGHILQLVGVDWRADGREEVRHVIRLIQTTPDEQPVLPFRLPERPASRRPARVRASGE